MSGAVLLNVKPQPSSLITCPSSCSLQSLPIAGRTPGYVVGVFIFTISQIPVIFAPNMGTLLFFRFLAGFVGSPALSTGGATIQDIVGDHSLA